MNAKVRGLVRVWLKAFVTALSVTQLSACFEGSSGADEFRGSWGAAALIEDHDTGDAMASGIAMDTEGNALMVSQVSGGTRKSIWSQRYIAASGWDVAELIETDDAGDAESPVVAFDAEGNALAGWQQSDGALYHAWASRYTAGIGWETPEELLEGGEGNAARPQIVFDPLGNALALWLQWDDSGPSLWSNRYTMGIGWGTAELIDNVDSSLAPRERLGMDAEGNAMAVWEASNGLDSSDIWSSRYAPGSGWGEPELVEDDAGSVAVLPELAVDSEGNGILLWLQWDGGEGLNLWSKRYLAGSGWGSAQLISNGSGDVISQQIKVDAAGNALAMWAQWDGERERIWFNRYTVGIGWGVPELFGRDDAADGSLPEFAFALDAAGNALAVWSQFDGTRNNVWSSRYTVGSGWGAAELIEEDDTGDAYSPMIVLDAAGNATAVWNQWDGTRFNIWSNRFTRAPQ